jgi:hypothetical protein
MDELINKMSSVDINSESVLLGLFMTEINHIKYAVLYSGNPLEYLNNNALPFAMAEKDCIYNWMNSCGYNLCYQKIMEEIQNQHLTDFPIDPNFEITLNSCISYYKNVILKNKTYIQN